MKDEHEEYLVKTYPKLYGKVEFEVGDGWFTILNGLARCIQEHVDQTIQSRWNARKRIRRLQDDPDADLSTEVIISDRVRRVKVVQIKEKFGTLRFYIGAGGDDDIYSYIQMAEVMSSITCENCGAPGTRTSPPGWIRTLCPTCATARK